MKDLKGTIHIARIYGGDESAPICIEIVESNSGAEAISVRLDLAEFAEAITGKGRCSCVIDYFNDSGVIGMKAEHKTEIVPVPPFGERSDGWEDKALAPFEVDGWSARRADITNSHRKVKGGQAVVFFRHVREDGSPI